MSASVDLEGTSFGLESCLSADEIYLLDKRASTGIESFVSLRAHPAVVAGLRAFIRLEKEMQHFTAATFTGISFFINGGTKRLMARIKSVRDLPKASYGGGGSPQE